MWCASLRSRIGHQIGLTEANVSVADVVRSLEAAHTNSALWPGLLDSVLVSRRIRDTVADARECVVRVYGILRRESGVPNACTWLISGVVGGASAQNRAYQPRQN